MRTILIVEDEEELNAFLRDLLSAQRFTVHSTPSGVQALKLVESTQPDLVILDVGLPDIDGQTVCEQIKQMYPGTPVIMLTARDRTSDKVESLNRGADDYMTKPFAGEELLARVKVQLRRQGGTQRQMTAGDLTLDTETLQVTRGDQEIQLTPQEFRLLEYLLSNQGRVLTREMILSRVWSAAPDIETRVVDVYIGYLRKKIDRDYPVKLIQSVRGFGYMLKAPAETAAE